MYETLFEKVIITILTINYQKKTRMSEMKRRTVCLVYNKWQVILPISLVEHFRVSQKNGSNYPNENIQ